MPCTVTRRGRAGRWPWGGVFSLCGRQGSCSESEEALKMCRQQFWGARRGAPVLRGCGLEVAPPLFLLDSAGRQEGSWGWLGRVRICTGLTASWAGKGTGDRTGDRRPAQGGRAGTGEWAAQARSVFNWARSRSSASEPPARAAGRSERTVGLRCLLGPVVSGSGSRTPSSHSSVRRGQPHLARATPEAAQACSSVGLSSSPAGKGSVLARAECPV